MSLDKKKAVIRHLNRFNHWVAQKPQFQDFESVFSPLFSRNLTADITAPFEQTHSLNTHIDSFWKPLLTAFPDLENQPYILIGGEYQGRSCVSLTGNMIGTFTNPWLGIPATQQPTWIRYAVHFLFQGEEITRAWYFIDTLDVMRQAGFSFFPSRGVQCVPPAPMTGDGIVDYEVHADESGRSLKLTDDMLNGLGSYDGETLDSMGQERFWDIQNMMWYGPSGIGTTRGLNGFQKNHQIPFLIGFPGRGITAKDDQDHFAQYGDGNYSCDFGFPAMYGTHLGDGWLGLKATGKEITLRVMDFWRREGKQLKENWVFIDMIDVLSQLGVDVFGLLNQKIKGKN